MTFPKVKMELMGMWVSSLSTYFFLLFLLFVSLLEGNVSIFIVYDKKKKAYEYNRSCSHAFSQSNFD
ncbi:hypothetical protein BLGI_2201 [Brevibacillus laterosporus GI-9]|nr:hypothetical protein BLGI_2201 [Brevibacillus laterosporus GI-9]